MTILGIDIGGSGVKGAPVDTVRGEVVVGNGYPYAIEAADATAVITTRDRETFYAVFQEFAERERLDLRIARKAISKAQRR